MRAHSQAIETHASLKFLNTGRTRDLTERLDPCNDPSEGRPVEFLQVPFGGGSNGYLVDHTGSEAQFLGQPVQGFHAFGLGFR